MIAKYTYWYFKNALTNEQCEKIIDLGHSKKISQAETRGKNHKTAEKKLSQKDKSLEEFKKELKSRKLSDKKINDLLKKESYVRDSEVSWINDQWIYDLVWPFLIEANNKSGWKYDFDFAECFQFTTYKKDAFYGWHIDGNTDHNAAYGENCNNKNYIGKIRKLSVTINLSDESDYKGGNLKFDLGPHQKNRFLECKEIRPRGSIVIFPSSVYHQVTPITKGVRKSLVMWVLGKPFK